MSDEEKISRLVEIANNPSRESAERLQARETLQKVAPHLFLPDQRILTPEQHSGFQTLLLRAEEYERREVQGEK